MAILILWNIDIPRSLNSRDSFQKGNLKIRLRQGIVQVPPTISFELHAKTEEEIDLEKCNFCNFGSSVTLTLDRVEVTLVCISGRGLPTDQIRSKLEKLFVDVWMDVRRDGHTRVPIYSVIAWRWPKNWMMRCWRSYLSAVRCKYGPADVTAATLSLASLKSRML